VRKILSDLNYDFDDFTINHFSDWIGDLKGRTIIRIAWDMPPGLFGAWMSDGDEPREYIFYRRNASPLHQIHIQLHELAHFLCGHPTKLITRNYLQESKDGIVALPFNDLVKLRSPNLSHYELEAEYLASLIQEQVIRHAQLQQLTKGISSDEKIASYLKDLGLS